MTVSAVLLVSVLGTAAIAAARPPSAPETLDPTVFTPVDVFSVAPPTDQLPAPAESDATTAPEIADFTARIDPAAVARRLAPPPEAGKTADAKAVAKALPKPAVRHPATHHRVAGTSTWYCRTGASPCHYAHSGGMYAAAGGEIRQGDWRGRHVKVCQGGRCVWVTLIDWCACAGNRIIDLYSDAYRQLQPLSTGTMPVTVSW